MKYLLDTDAFSDLARGDDSVSGRFSLVSTSLVGISTVTLKEIEYGRRLNPQKVTRRNARIDTLLRQIAVLPFDLNDAYTAGQIRAALARIGTPIGPYDVMIAGVALARGLVLVTANTREFSRVRDLQLENWRATGTEVRESTAEYRVIRTVPPHRNRSQFVKRSLYSRSQEWPN